MPTLELLLAGVALSPAVADAARRLLPGPFTLVVPYPDGVTFPPCGRVALAGAPTTTTMEPGDDGADDGEGMPPGRLRHGGRRGAGVRRRSCPRWACACRRGRPRPGRWPRCRFPLLASSANLSGEHDPAGLAGRRARRARGL